MRYFPQFMNPGRELDALVASHIMGFKVVSSLSEGCMFLELNQELFWMINKGEPVTIPHYSTDISAAWKVVEKLRGDHFLFELLSREMEFGLVYLCMFYKSGQVPNLYDSSGLFDTAPHAICLAAMKAKETL